VTVGSSTIRRDEYDVDEDGGEDGAGHKDNREEDAAKRSTCVVRLLAQLSKCQRVGSCTIRCDEYNVDEDGVEDDAGRKDNRK